MRTLAAELVRPNATGLTSTRTVKVLSWLACLATWAMSDPRYRSEPKASCNEMFNLQTRTLKLKHCAKGERKEGCGQQETTDGLCCPGHHPARETSKA